MAACAAASGRASINIPAVARRRQAMVASLPSLSLIAQLVREHEPRQMPQAQLEVTVVGSSLAPMDRNGLSDPYCVLTAAPCAARRLASEALDPKWGETFRFEVAPGQATQLQLDCFDHDIFSSTTSWGCFKIKVDDLLAEGRPATTTFNELSSVLCATVRSAARCGCGSACARLMEVSRSGGAMEMRAMTSRSDALVS